MNVHISPSKIKSGEGLLVASGVTIPRLNPDRGSSEVSDPTSLRGAR